LGVAGGMISLLIALLLKPNPHRSIAPSKNAIDVVRKMFSDKRL
jgi:hypothetical protein